jgi:hypothetical protein
LTSPGTATIDLTNFPLDADYDVVDVLAVYDHTADPDHDTDLLSSFADPVITLTGAIPLGNIVWVDAVFAPEIAVTTSSDFPQVAKIPAVWIKSFAPLGPRRTLGVSGPGITDQTLAVPAGTVFPQPTVLRDFLMSFNVVAPLSLNLLSLSEALENWMLGHPTLTILALDAQVRLDPGEILDWATSQATAEDTRVASGSLVLRNVPIFGQLAIGAADDSATAAVGPVDAGDPNFPGVGYGVKRLVISINPVGDTGCDETVIVTE